MDFDQLRVKDYRFWTLYLHENQGYLGRCYLALKREGDIDPFIDCTLDEWIDLIGAVNDEVTPALYQLFQPTKYNYGNLRNVWPHCHWHIVPRYSSAREFDGTTFTDEQWGHNWSTDRKLVVPDLLLARIRDDLIEALG